MPPGVFVTFYEHQLFGRSDGAIFKCLDLAEMQHQLLLRVPGVPSCALEAHGVILCACGADLWLASSATAVVGAANSQQKVQRRCQKVVQFEAPIIGLYCVLGHFLVVSSNIQLYAPQDIIQRRAQYEYILPETPRFSVMTGSHLLISGSETLYLFTRGRIQDQLQVGAQIMGLSVAGVLIAAGNYKQSATFLAITIFAERLQVTGCADADAITGDVIWRKGAYWSKAQI